MQTRCQGCTSGIVRGSGTSTVKRADDTGGRSYGAGVTVAPAILTLRAAWLLLSSLSRIFPA